MLPTLPPDNPFAARWDTPHGVPPFAAIRPEHYEPAFAAAIAAHRAEVEAVATQGEPPSFANTIEALERAGRALRRVSAVFFNLSGSDTNDALQAIERTMAPVLSRHRSAIYLDGRLHARIADLFARRESLGLTPEQDRVLERYEAWFRRAGAGVDAPAKERLAAISERLAVLATQFGQNVLADEKHYVLPLDGEADLADLPESLRAAAAIAAAERGLPGHVVTLARSLVEPFLVSSTRPDLREEAYRAWTRRGEGRPETDNSGLIAEIVALRAERAKLLGYDSFAHFKLDDAMAKTPEAVAGLLDAVWTPARAKALEEREALEALAQAEGGNARIGAADWRHYAERRRKALHDLDEAEIKAYLPLDQVIEAAFHVANRLFGLSFAPRPDVPVYHPDVRAFEVTDAGGGHVGLFLGDYFARASKRSGAWMSALRSQEALDGPVRPIIVNVMSFAKAAAGEACLLSFDDARTLFHEFGHALHGLLSDVTYPAIAGTSVAGDFVELPSQLYEHWLSQPEVLRRFARHHRTGEPMPDALIERVLAARNDGQGFGTVEYLGSAFVDLDFHLDPDPRAIDARAVEAATRARLGIPEEIAMRHRPPHFAHIFSSEGYAAGYYSYLWSEVLDADAFEAFEETGDVFDPSLAERLKTFIYAAGGRQDPRDAYTAFRGRLPTPDALLRKRGLA
ncbi:MAG TPA: M3 family metallopeptidase [Beijerinckiaceae bacterium]|jgi:peptidyl-dipeptidase Dcp